MKYRIDSMELRTESSESRVVVSVTNQSAASSDVVLVTAYPSGEQYQWMVLDDVRNLAIGTTTEITLPVDLSAIGPVRAKNHGQMVGNAV